MLALGLNVCALLGLVAFQVMCMKTFFSPPWVPYRKLVLREGERGFGTLQPITLAQRSGWRWRYLGWWAAAFASLFILKAGPAREEGLGDAGEALDVVVSLGVVLGFLGLGLTGLLCLIGLTDDGQPSCREHRLLLRPQLAPDGLLECRCPADGCATRASGNPFRTSQDEDAQKAEPGGDTEDETPGEDG